MSVKIIHHLVNVVVGSLVQETKEKRRQRGDADQLERCVREECKAITQMRQRPKWASPKFSFVFFVRNKLFSNEDQGSN